MRLRYTPLWCTCLVRNGLLASGRVNRSVFPSLLTDARGHKGIDFRPLACRGEERVCRYSHERVCSLHISYGRENFKTFLKFLDKLNHTSYGNARWILGVGAAQIA